MSVKREVSEKNRKFHFNWEQTTVSCEVSRNIRSEKVFMRHYSAKHEKTYGKYQGTPKEEF